MELIKTKDLIKGKWYCNTNWRSNSAAKFNSIRYNRFIYDSKIDPHLMDGRDYYKSYNDTYFLASIEFLKKHLPEGHPDLNQEITIEIW